jgi:hypothetical protein
MKKNPLSFIKTFSIGLRDGILIFIALATIAPFVYREVLERTDSNSNVVIGSVHILDVELPDRPFTPTPEPLQPTSVPTPMPTPTLQAPTTEAAPVVNGGFIKLNLEEIRPGLWTQVQWLAGDGNWYDVNGWGGHLNEGSSVLWFVGSNHLGAQPAFRWRVFDAEGGTLLATSEQFYLPKAVRETVQVTVSMPAK